MPRRLDAALGAVVKTPRRLRAALGAVVLLAALGAGTLNPSRAEAGVIGDLLDGLKEIGGDVLQSALEWLFGGLQAAITLPLVEFLVKIELPIGESLQAVTGPIIVIGGFFLVVGLITSVGAGYREIVAGTDTAARVIGSAIFRVIGLALLLGSWFWIVPLAVDVANGMSSYVLSDDGVAQAVRRAAATQTLLSFKFPLLALVMAVFLSIALLVLVVLKFIMMIAFACLYVGGPALIGFAALPGVGRLPLSLATRGVVTLALIPLAWAVVFAAWAGVSAGTVDSIGGDGSGIVNALMGPGLFFAGLVVLLAVTKKVLSMAAFGLALSVPGAGIARSVVNRAAAQAVLGGAGGAGASDGAEQIEKASRKGGGGAAADSTGAQDGGAGAGQGQPSGAGQGQRQWRTLDTGGRVPAKNPTAARIEHQADTETERRDEQVRDAEAVGSVRGGDYTNPGKLPRGDPDADRTPYQQMHDDIEEQGLVRGQLSPRELHDVAGQDLPGGNRSAQAGLARQAIAEHPDDRARAQAQYTDATARQLAGVEMQDPQRQAFGVAGSQNPHTVVEAWGADWHKHAWMDPEQRPPAHPGEQSASPTNYDAGIAHALGESPERPGQPRREG